MMDDLVTAAAPDQHRVFKILYEFTVDQHVNQIDNLHLRGGEFIQR